MDLYEKHIELVEAVNNAKTELEHILAVSLLAGWREGCSDAGKPVSLIDADLYYIDQGIERPICCGEFLDWKPA